MLSRRPFTFFINFICRGVFFWTPHLKRLKKQRKYFFIQCIKFQAFLSILFSFCFKVLYSHKEPLSYHLHLHPSIYLFINLYLTARDLTNIKKYTNIIDITFLKQKKMLSILNKEFARIE